MCNNALGWSPWLRRSHPNTLVPHPMCAVLHKACPKGPSHPVYKQCSHTALVSAALQLEEGGCLRLGTFCAFVNLSTF